jgi:hypothetical protein
MKHLEEIECRIVNQALARRADVPAGAKRRPSVETGADESDRALRGFSLQQTDVRRHVIGVPLASQREARSEPFFTSLSLSGGSLTKAEQDRTQERQCYPLKASIEWPRPTLSPASVSSEGHFLTCFLV